MKKWFYLTAYCIPALVFTGYYLGGVFNFLTPAVVYIMIPLLDLAIGVDTFNEKEPRYRGMREEKFYRIITWLHVPLQAAMVVWGAWVVGTGRVTLLEGIGFTLSMGIVTGGLGITIAHELGHRTNRFEQNLSKILLWTVS